MAWNSTAQMDSKNATKIIPLQFWMCFFFDSEDGNYRTIKPNLIFNCRSQGKFLAGNDEIGQHYGRVLCIIILALIYVVGVFGFVTNIMNVLVLRKSLKGSAVSLKCLLIMLALFELLACLFSITFATVIILIMENVNRGEFIIYLLKMGHILYSYGRTGAIYITILVTIERYLVVAFPIRSKAWLTPFRSKLYVVLVLILTFFLDLPWILNNTVVKNTLVKLAPNTSLVEYPYILNGTDFARVVYPKIRSFQLFTNYIAPFPLLLLFNGLLYFSIHNWNKSRQTLSSKQKREINAAKVFSIVVLILLSCHSVSCFLVFFAQFMGIVYRELMLLQLLSVTMSAAVNFLVYVGFGKAFRQELRNLTSTSYAALTGRKLVPSSAETNARTQSSGDGESSNVAGDKQGRMREI